MRSAWVAWLIGGMAVGVATLPHDVAVAGVLAMVAGGIYATFVWLVCAIVARF